MKKLFILILAALSLSACIQKQATSDVPEDAVRALCEDMVRTYPQATLQDLYKTCYQDFFGAEHMIRDTASVKRYLHYEIEQCATEDLTLMPAQEPTGFRHRFVRVNLRCILDGQMTEDELFEAFLDAANTSTPVHTDWQTEWSQIETIALQVHPAWVDTELQKTLHEAAQANCAVHHSDAFRNAYHPHYRIIKNQ